MKNKRLKHYKNWVWDKLIAFEAFSIMAILRSENTRAYSLAISASLFLPHPNFKTSEYRIEMIYHPSVPDNEDWWQVFNDDCVCALSWYAKNRQSKKYVVLKYLKAFPNLFQLFSHPS